MNDFEQLSKVDKDRLIESILIKARDYWNKENPRLEATDLDKMRLFHKTGLIKGILEGGARNEFYRREGFWLDGMTTLEVREKQIIHEKMETIKKMAKLRDSHLGNIDEILKRVQERKAKLLEVPEQLKIKYNIHKDQIRTEIERDLQILHQDLLQNVTSSISNVYNECKNELRRRKTEIVNTRRAELNMLIVREKKNIEHEIDLLSVELETELSLLESKQKDDELIKIHQEKLKELNREFNSLYPKKNSKEKTLEGLTVKELKILADEKEITYEAQIRKADLIEKIKEVA